MKVELDFPNGQRLADAARTADETLEAFVRVAVESRIRLIERDRDAAFAAQLVLDELRNRQAATLIGAEVSAFLQGTPYSRFAPADMALVGALRVAFRELGGDISGGEGMRAVWSDPRP